MVNADVAVLIVAEFKNRDYMPNIIRFASERGMTPPKFEAVELIKSLFK